MFDLGPVLHLLGLILLVLGLTMLGPVAMDLYDGNDNIRPMLRAMIETSLFGLLLALASKTDSPRPLTLRQAYVLTAGIWVLVPAFGALPFMHGAPNATFTDAYFEAMSGITTTGYTVFTKIETLPRGVLLWRAMLNWMGGLGIAFVAMIFLPVMRVGGMRYFQTEGFDTLGKVLPRARDIAIILLEVYSTLTFLCALTYLMCGMPMFDALIHSLATIATGGFGSYDASFAKWSPAVQYAGVVFMILGAMPYVRFFQLVNGQSRAFWRDPQIRAFLRWLLIACTVVVAYRLWKQAAAPEGVIRETLFNLTSIMTGTGFGTASVDGWGPFPVTVAFLIGMIGGCTGSSSAGLSVFRVQVIFSVLRTAVRQLHAPNRVLVPRYDGKPLDETTIGPLMQYVTAYIMTLGLCAVLISLDGADMSSAIFASWGALGNIGYAMGPLPSATGTMADFGDGATWVMSLAMLLGRLGLLGIFVLFLPRFWQD